MTTTAELCGECVRAALEPDASRTRRKPRWWDALAGLGIPLDFWILAGVVLLYLATRTVVLGFEAGTIVGFMQVLFPAGIILLAEQIGGFSGFIGFYRASETPPAFVKCVGWIFLLSLIGYSSYGMFFK